MTTPLEQLRQYDGFSVACFLNLEHDPKSSLAIWDLLEDQLGGRSDLRIAKFDATAEQRKPYGLKVLPSVRLYSGGRLVEEVTGRQYMPEKLGELFVRIEQAHVDSHVFSAMSTPRYRASGDLHPDLGLVVCGGLCDGEFLRTVEVLNLETGEWRLLSEMKTPRMGHTLTALEDGRLLVIGGSSPSERYLRGTEIYDPVKDRWSEGPQLRMGRYSHKTNKLADGRLFITGGFADRTQMLGAEAELFDPQNTRFQPIAQPKFERVFHAATAMHDDSIVVMGGAAATKLLLGPKASILEIECWNPRLDAWRITSELSQPRRHHTADAISQKEILVAGGVGAWDPLKSAEVVNYETGMSTTIDMPAPRTNHSSLAKDDAIYIFGGRIGPHSASSVLKWSRKRGFEICGFLKEARQGPVGVIVNSGLLVAGGATEGLEISSCESVQL